MEDNNKTREVELDEIKEVCDENEIDYDDTLCVHDALYQRMLR